MFLLFDFGAPALATKLAAESRATIPSILRVIALTAIPPSVLAVVAVSIWPAYAEFSGLSAFDVRTVLTVIAVVGIGSSLRSVASVYAAISLGRRRYGARAWILLVSALGNAVSTLAALSLGCELYALGIGVLVGGALGTTAALVIERHLDRGPSDVEASRLVRIFMTSKGAATIAGLVITQLDRWALGLAGDDVLLAQYDLLTRVIQVPKIALLALLVGLVGEATGLTRLEVRALWRRATLVTVIAFGAAQVSCVPVGIGLAANGSSLSPSLVLLAFGLASAQLTLTATIPVTYIVAGRGAPQLELLYLVPLFVCVVATYAAGIFAGDASIIVVGWMASVSAASLAYVLCAPKLLERTT